MAYRIGITLQGRPYDEGTVIKLAYAYEQETRHRKPPNNTPPLPGARRVWKEPSLRMQDISYELLVEMC